MPQNIYFIILYHASHLCPVKCLISFQCTLHFAKSIVKNTEPESPISLQKLKYLLLHSRKIISFAIQTSATGACSLETNGFMVHPFSLKSNILITVYSQLFNHLKLKF